MPVDVPYRSIPDMFLARVAATPDRDALGYPAPDGSGPAWLTWSQVARRAAAIAAGLHGLGVGAEDRVAILANTRLEWVLADLGIMCAGGATTTVYPTTEPDDAAFILRDSGSKVLLIENQEQAAKLTGALPSSEAAEGGLAALTHVVLIDGGVEPDANPPQLTLEELERRGSAALAADPGLVDRLVAGIAPEWLATLIYTSGTTDRPKGVELTHACWTWQGVAQSGLGILEPTDLHYLWLPLSHAFGKTVVCGVINTGVPSYVDGRIDAITENLERIRPTLMCSPPRTFEKIYNRVVATATEAGGPKSRIFAWAVRVGKQKVAYERAGRAVPRPLAIRYALATKLVFSKLHARLGGRIRVLVSGSAPLSPQIAEFFAAAGLPVLEGYGLTEAAAGNFVNRPGRLRVGTVGEIVGDLEVRLDQDGEVLLRGTPVMRGYHNLPAETEAAFTGDGFLRTGDIGVLDADGYLRITDRKKDLVKTSGGKYVAPSRLEGMFKALCPYVSQVLVVGQARNFCTMLVTLDPDSIVEWAAHGPLAGRPYQEIVTSPDAEAMVGGYVKELNSSLNRWETIKKFAILPRDLAIDAGELTPSMKIRRRVVEDHFNPEIEKMYEGTVAPF